MRFKKNVRMTLLYLAFIVIGVAMVFPFIWMIATSFKTGTDIYSLSLLPKKFTLENYREVLSGSDFPRWFLNSFLVAGITTLSVLVFDPLLGYAFCKYRFRGKEAIFTMLLSTMMIPTEMMIIPWYMMVNQLDWNNTYWSMLFPGLSSAFGIFLMRQFFTGVPNELLDAGRIDGLSEFGVYTRIALPLVTPALSALGIFTFLGNWNSFLWPVIALDSKEKYTITLGLAQFSAENASQWELLMTGASVATIPIIIIFLIFQKKIIGGISMGAVKG